tara:strand:- start:717 stop:1274 length:558 start_codon:yes stop_codon:yes gene_type:complete
LFSKEYYGDNEMAISLYDLGVKSYLQIVPAVSGFLEKGRRYFEENQRDLDEIVKLRLYDDMAPFTFQLFSVAHHSLGAINGLQSGEFNPPNTPSGLNYGALQELISNAEAQLRALDADTVNGFEGGEVVFKMGSTSLPFVAEDFIMSFSLPNFYFHATTAYDILRKEGVPLGKMDFLGGMRMKGA